MNNDDRARFFRHPALRVLRRCLRRESLLKLTASAALLAAGLGMLVFFFDQNIILTVLGLILSVTALRLFLRELSNWRIESHRLMVLLADHPGQIVWVYSVVTERLPFGFRFARNGILYFKLADGDEITVNLPASELRLVSRHLNRLLPHASFGYTRDRAQWYLASPELLRKK